MEDVVITDEDLKRQPRPKSSKSKRRTERKSRTKETVGFDSFEDGHTHGDDNRVTDETEKGYRRRKKHYVNEGFEDDVEMEHSKKQKVKKKRDKSNSRLNDVTGDETNDKFCHNEEVETYDGKSERKSKKKAKKFRPVDDDPYDDLKEIERQLELLGTTKTDTVDPAVENVTEVKPHRRKKRKPKSIVEADFNRTPPYDESANNFEQPNDTGYESFNNKKETRSRKNKGTNDTSVVGNEEDSRPIVVHYNSDQGESPKVTRKKKRHKIRRKDDLEEHIVNSSQCSPVSNSRVIKVHERTHKKIANSDDEMNFVEEELMQETKKSNKLKKKKKLKVVEQLSENLFDESEDIVDGCDVNDLIDKLEEITLPSEKKHRSRETDANEVQGSEDLHHGKNTSKRKSKSSKHEMDDNSYLKTEVVPFSLDSSSDSESIEKNKVQSSRKYQKSHDFDTKPIVSESLEMDRNKRYDEEDSVPKGSSKPVKRYAFDGDSDNSTENDDSDEESVQETHGKKVEVPVKNSPKKSKKDSKLYRNAVVTQSSNFENFPDSSPDLADKPPRPIRKSQYEMSQSSSHSSLSSLKGIFSIDGNSYDVFEKDDCITWSCVSGASKVPRSRKKSFVRGMSSSSGGSFRGSIASLGSAEIDELNTIFYQDILGVSLKKEKRSKSKNADSVCIGLTIYTYDKKEYNRLKERAILFHHPSEMECTRWMDMIKDKLKDFQRPHFLKVFVQPWAGISRSSMLTYNTKIAQIFEIAELETETVVVNHNEHIKQEVTHTDLDTVDCVVAMGGDGTASRVISAVLNKSQEAKGVEKRPHFTPVKPPVTFGIIPTGMTNHIGHSVMGIEDPVTAAIHIVLGTTRLVDVCSVFRDDQFSIWSFNGHYGYFGNVLTFLHRYAMFGEKKVDAAFMKGLTKSKFRSYECDIQYIKAPSSDRNNVMDGKVCTSECKRCNFDPDTSFGSAYSDEVHELNQLDESQHGHGVMELEDKSRWTTAKGNFINVSVFSIPALSHLSPHGMSMYTHLADGFIDLALVHSVDRKQFLRFLRRHGKKKNQFDFPFVETVRCREVRIQLRLKETWKHKDYDYNEIDYEVKKSEQSQLKRTESVEVIDELESDDSDVTEDILDLEESDEDEYEEEVVEKKSGKKKEKEGKSGKSKDKKKDKDTDDSKSDKSGEKKKRFSFFSKKKDKRLKDDAENVGEDEKEVNDVMEFGNSDSDWDERPGSKAAKCTDEFVHVLELESSDEDNEEVETVTSKKKEKISKKKRLQSLFEVTPAPPPDQRKAYQPPDFLEMDRQYRKKQERKKSEKKKAKAERRMKSYWNIDNELQPEGCYHFRVHQGLVRIHGAGVAVNTHHDEVTMKCLGVF